MLEAKSLRRSCSNKMSIKPFYILLGAVLLGGTAFADDTANSDAVLSDSLTGLGASAPTPQSRVLNSQTRDPLGLINPTFMGSKGELDNAGIHPLGGRLFLDRSLEVSKAIQADRYFEVIGVSTPSTPSTGHARVFLSSSTHQVCSVFDDGTAGCFSSSTNIGTITGVTAGTGLSGGGTTGTVTLNVNPSSVTMQGNTFNGNSQLVQTNSSGKITSALLPSDVVYNDSAPSATFSSSVTVTSPSGLYTSYGATLGSTTLRNVASGTQCLHADGSGNITGTGSDCASTTGFASLSATQTWTGTNTFQGVAVFKGTAPFSGWVSYTPTFSAGWGTVANISMFWRRVGDTLEVRGYFKTGTVATSVSSMSIPSGQAIDTTKIPTGTANTAIAGSWYWDSGSTWSAANGIGALFSDGTTTDSVFFAAGTSTTAMTKTGASSVAGSNNGMEVDFKVPIVGWSF